MRLLLIFLFIPLLSLAQIIPTNRVVDWSNAGMTQQAVKNYLVVDVVASGADATGTIACDSIVSNIITTNAGKALQLYFKPGSYLFNNTITLKDSVLLKGAGADSTFFKFDLGGTGNCIEAKGSFDTTATSLFAGAMMHDTVLSILNTSGFNVGDYLVIQQRDSTLVTSNWALNSVGQIARVKYVSALGLVINSPLRKNFLISTQPKITKINPIHFTGIECVNIERIDASAGQTKNISFQIAANSWVRGVESNKCNFSHIEISRSTNIEVQHSYFKDAHDYGGGGKAYGVMIHFTSGECLIENNIFKQLRHSMILQAGANGNVFGYNYSIDPFWTGTSLPPNSSGDVVCHGNYVNANLFEGNIAQNMVIDDSHGINGPLNTFFRNRFELLGMFMNNAPASDQQNFVGNEVTSTTPFQGLYFLSGSNHFEHGNNIKGTIMPTGSNALSDTTYYLKKLPIYMQSLPKIGTPYPYNTASNPAKERYLKGEFAVCEFEKPDTSTAINSEPVFAGKIYPNPTTGVIYVKVDGNNNGLKIELYSMEGKIQMVKSINSNEPTALKVDHLATGIYLLKVLSDNELIGIEKVVIQN